MKLTSVFAEKYPIENNENLKKFTKKVRWFADSVTIDRIKQIGISQLEIKEELKAGLIRYEPNVFKGIRGYTITSKGIKAIYDYNKKSMQS